MLPLSLYIHIPWCIRKCPYCDFNSHNSPNTLPEDDYINALIYDLKHDVSLITQKQIQSIFIGGGTPSLISAKAYERLFTAIQQHLDFVQGIEITLEANPGTVDTQRFKSYRSVGINRLSIGIQSFNKTHLSTLGRIHDDKQTHHAIEQARLAGFDNINLDIMHSLPNQTLEEGIRDLGIALSYCPEHLSWYQLTIEPNTLFYKTPPILPPEDLTCSLEEDGFKLLKLNDYEHYEVSAFCKPNKTCQHNLNYWLFGDYLGIGAGAHGKITMSDEKTVYRTKKHRQPKDYLNENKTYLIEKKQILSKDLLFEFMLNTTRLQQPIPKRLFEQRTGLNLNLLMPKLIQAQKKGLITINDTHWQVTPFGQRYVNDLQTLFLPDNTF